MAKTIPIKISIDNRQAKSEATEVKNEVKKIGVEGKKAGEKAGKELTKGFKGAKKAILSAKSAMVGLMAVVTTGAFVTMAKDSLEAADKIGKTAAKLGLTTDALQEYRFAASQSGIAMRTFDMSFQRFGRRIAEVANDQGELLITAKQYGLQVKDNTGKMLDINEIFYTYGNLIKNAATDQEALRLAFKAFDSEGAVMVNLFRDGSKGVEEYRRQARELGLVMDESVIKKSTEVIDKLDILKKQLGKIFTEAIVDNARAIADSFGLIATAAITIGKAVSLRPVFATRRQRVELEEQGFLERGAEYEGFRDVQERVDDVLQQIKDATEQTSRYPTRGSIPLPTVKVDPKTLPESPAAKAKRQIMEARAAKEEALRVEKDYVQRMLELDRELTFQQNSNTRERGETNRAYTETIAREQEEREKSYEMEALAWEGVFDDWSDGIEEIEEKWLDWKNLVIDSSHGMSDAFADFATGSEMRVKDMINSMIKDLIRFAAQKYMFGPLMGGLAGLFPSQHTGSDSPGMQRRIPVLHNGLRANEYSAVLEKGEGVSTKEQMRSGSGVNISMTVVKGSQPNTTLEERPSTGNMEKQLLLIVGSDIAQRGSLARTFEGTYDIKRKGRNV